MARTGRRASATTLVVALALAALAGLFGTAIAWHHHGGRWYVVTSPSMGTAMPVGSLVITRPTAFDDIEVGDIITFRTPRAHTVYSHRVVSRTPESLVTRGDINPVADPEPTVAPDLIGRVAWHLPGLGWLLRAVPMIIVGLAATWLVTRFVREKRRYSVRSFGTALTVSVVGWLLHPWIGLVKLDQAAPADGSPGVLIKLVSTGLLPTQAYEVDGSAATALRSGQVSTLHLTHLEHGGGGIAGRLDLSWWGWVLLAVVVLSPLLWTLVRGLPPVPPDATPAGPGRHVANDDLSRLPAKVAA